MSGWRNESLVIGGILGNWIDYGPNSTIVGWAGTPTANLWYRKVGSLVFLNLYIDGTSNSSSSNFTMPYTSKASANFNVRAGMEVQDNSTWQTTPGMVLVDAGSNVAILEKGFAGGETDWTASGNKTCQGQFWYEAS